MLQPNSAREKQSYAFNTTQWSLILSSGAPGPGETSSGALAQLCHIYWRPIFAYIRHRGFPSNDAKDLTQDFFLMMLAGNYLQGVDPERGRFRNFLRKSLQRFLQDAQAKRTSLKRGGQHSLLSWDEWTSETQGHFMLAPDIVEKLTPERLFDVRWAATVVEEALRELREECEACGRRRVYDVLSGVLSAEQQDVSYDKLAKRLRVEKLVVKRLIYEMRRRYRDLLRLQVARTVSHLDEVDEEIRYLCVALSLDSRH